MIILIIFDIIYNCRPSVGPPNRYRKKPSLNNPGQHFKPDQQKRPVMQHLRPRKKKQRQKLQKQHHSKKHDNNNKKQQKTRKQPKQVKSHNPRKKVQKYNIHTLSFFTHV